MGERPRNNDNDVEKQLRRAEKSGGWTVEYPSGHWGRLVCHGDATGHCSMPVSGTPKGSGTFKTVRSKLRKCRHGHSL